MQPMPELFPEPHQRSAVESTSSRKQKNRRPKGSRIQNIIVGCLVIGLAASTGVIAFYGIGPLLAPPIKPQVASSAPDVVDVLGINDQPYLQDVFNTEEKQALVQNLASLIEIPAAESQVTILGITSTPADPGEFFSKAEIGDAVVIFPKSSDAYLYRPQSNQIIATGKLEL